MAKSAPTAPADRSIPDALAGLVRLFFKRPAAASFSSTRAATKGAPFIRINAVLWKGSIAVWVILLFLLAWTVFAPPQFSVGAPLLIIAIAAFGVGMLAGFISGATSDEKQTFSSMSTALNGVIGGFALSDLTKADGTIRKILWALAKAANQPGIGLVGAIVGLFGALGFMFMYMNKQYVLNPSLSMKQAQLERNERIGALTRTIKVSLAELGTKPEVDEAELASIQTALVDLKTAVEKDEQLLDFLNVETLHAYSKAYYVAADYESAEGMLRRARALAPDNIETLFLLAHVLITAGRPREAVPYLMHLQGTANTPILTWKLLGYACLWEADLLDESERATLKYLAIHPQDPGAKFNLLCAQAQRGPGGASDVLVELEKLVKRSPEAAKLLVRISGQPPAENDFHAWRDDKKFQAILAEARQIAASAPDDDES